jgi:hypothetical protein
VKEKSAGVAHQVEHIIRNDGVVGSSPITGTTSLQKLHTDQKKLDAREIGLGARQARLALQ